MIPFPYVTPSMSGNRFCNSSLPFPSAACCCRVCGMFPGPTVRTCELFQGKHVEPLDLLSKNWHSLPPWASAYVIPGIWASTSHYNSNGKPVQISHNSHHKCADRVVLQASVVANFKFTAVGYNCSLFC